MKTTLAAFSLITVLFTSSAFASDKVELARACFEKVTIQVGIQLSTAVHNAEPGSRDEALAQSRLDKFIDSVEVFGVMETACRENALSVNVEDCIVEGYRSEVKRIALIYRAQDVVASVPACSL